MPSKDDFHKKHPKVNAWMKERSSDQGRPSATSSGHAARREMSAQVQRLARRAGVDPDALAEKIPADTLRRTKYPVIEVVNPDGTRSFKHDNGIAEGPKPLIHR